MVLVRIYQNILTLVDQTETLDLLNENQSTTSGSDLNSIFQNNPGPLSLSNFANIYLRNLFKVTQ